MIVFDKVTKIYNKSNVNEKVAVKDISFRIKKDELVILKGHSGSGKTTILSLIAALIKPTEGSVLVEGKAISKLLDFFASKYRRDKIGMIFQRFNLIESLSIIDNIMIPQIPLKRKNFDFAIELLKDMQIEDIKNKPVKFLSGGERQKVAIIRALINKPDIILADEPTANLDKKSVEYFIHIISEIQKNDNKTIIIATHDDRIEQLMNSYKIINISDGMIK